MESFYEVTKKRQLCHLDTKNFVHVCHDLRYGPGENERFDLYLPEGAGPWPVVAEVHGGGWVYGDKSMAGVEPVFKAFISRGYAVASLAYTLAPAARFPQQAEEIRRAVRYLSQHAEELSLSTGQLFLYANSAGAYLTNIAALSMPETVNAAVSIYGVSRPDLIGAQLRELGLHGRYLTESADSMEGLLFGGSVSAFAERMRISSPSSCLRDFCPPLLLQHGKADATVPYLQSVRLADTVNSRFPGRAVLELFDDLDHSDPFFKSAKNTERIADFLDAVRCTTRKR